MRIVIAIPYGINQSGLIVFMTRMGEELAKRGLEVILVIRGNVKQWLGRKVESFETHRDLSEWLFQNISKYDVVIWAGFYQNSDEESLQIRDSISLRQQFKKIVLFFWERTGQKQIVATLEEMHLLISKACDGIIVLNNDQFEQVARFLNKRKIVVLPPGIDTKTEFTPAGSERDRHQLRQKYGWPSDLCVVLHLGRFVKRKRTDFLVNTWLHDTSLHNKGILILVGSGFGHPSSIEAELHQQVSNIQSIDIIPHDGESERTSYYRSADLFVVTGILEGEPSVLSEAMACGLPIIASDIPGHTGLVHNELTGLLYGVDDQTQLCKALHSLIDGYELRKKLGENARQYAVKYRDISITVDNLLNFLKELSF